VGNRGSQQHHVRRSIVCRVIGHEPLAQLAGTGAQACLGHDFLEAVRLNVRRPQHFVDAQTQGELFARAILHDRHYGPAPEGSRGGGDQLSRVNP
jgi:hypothetical protein